MKTSELIERLADQEHERWSGWMRHMFANWNEINVDRWKLLMDTPYAELSEHSKESDRKEARKTMEIVGPLLDQLEAVAKTQATTIVKLVNEIEALPKPPMTILKRWVVDAKTHAIKALGGEQ